MTENAEQLFERLQIRLERVRLRPLPSCINLFRQFQYETLSTLSKENEDWLLVRVVSNCNIVKKSFLFHPRSAAGKVHVDEMAAALLLTGADVRYEGKTFLGDDLVRGLCRDIPWECE